MAGSFRLRLWPRGCVYSPRLTRGLANVSRPFHLVFDSAPPSGVPRSAAARGASIGAPTAPPPPRCAIRPRARTARRSPARREQAGDGLSSLHVPRPDEVRDEWDVACAALILRRLRALSVAGGFSSPAGRPRGAPAVRH